MANSRRRYNNKLKVRGEIIEDKVQIKEEILKYYQNLYTETEAWRQTANFEDMPNLSGDDRDMLQETFDEEEVHQSFSLVFLTKHQA